MQSPHKLAWPVLRKVLVLCVGGLLLAVGLAMLVLPGPAIVFIPLGLAILATEFAWAKRWLARIRGWVKTRSQEVRARRAARRASKTRP